MSRSRSVLYLFTLSTFAIAPHCEPPRSTEGETVAVAAPPASPFGVPGSEPVASFELLSAGGDVRTNPGTFGLATDGGSLEAVAVRTNEVLDVDPVSGRPRVAGSTDPCTTGAEPACLPPDAEGAENLRAFDAVCDWTRADSLDGDFGTVLGPILEESCLPQLFSTPAVIRTLGNQPVTVLFGELLGDGDFWNAYALCAFIVCPVIGKPNGFDPRYTAFATVPLHYGGPADEDPVAVGGPPFPAGMPPSVGSLDVFLSDEQEAVLGCGPFHGTSCHLDGMDLRRAVANVLFQALPGAAGHTPGELPDGSIRPGARSPFDVDSGYDPSVDGCVLDLGDPIFDDLYGGDVEALLDPTGLCDGYAVPVPDGIWPGDRTQPDQTGATYTAEQIRDRFPTELAIVAENLRRLLVALSSTVGAPSACGDFAGGPFLPDDAVTPCTVVAEFESLTTVELPDDPSGPPAWRWLWETGAEYLVTTADGDLAPFADWTVHVFGPETPPGDDAEQGVPFLLADPQGMTAAPASPITLEGEGGDRTGAAGNGLATEDGLRGCRGRHRGKPPRDWWWSW